MPRASVRFAVESYAIAVAAESPNTVTRRSAAEWPAAAPTKASDASAKANVATRAARRTAIPLARVASHGVRSAHDGRSERNAYELRGNGLFDVRVPVAGRGQGVHA